MIGHSIPTSVATRHWPHRR